MTWTADRAIARIRGSGPLWIGGVASLVLFLFGVQLLGAATGAAAGPLEQFFGRHVAGDARALGAGWVATYALANGSVVAALSVSLFVSGIVTAPQLFLMVAGSRLGGAAIVVLIGALDYLGKRRYSFGSAISLGVLTFLLAHTVFVPATALGYLGLPWLQTVTGGVGVRFELSARLLDVLAPATALVLEAVGVGPGLVLAVVVLFAGLTLFDRVLGRVDTDWLRTRLFRRFRRRWVALALGVLVTGVTTSVAFSLGVIVPLYNRGYIERREVVPYVLGANIGTLLDTLVVAVVLESPEAAALVFTLGLVAALVTLVAMLSFDPYLELVEAVQARLVEDRRALAAFLVSLAVVPLVLAVFPA